MIRVAIPAPLRSYSGGASEVEAEGGTLAQVVADLDRRFPGLRFRIVDEQDRIRAHVKLFVGDSLAPDLSAPVAARDRVHVICALSGGSRP